MKNILSKRIITKIRIAAIISALLAISMLFTSCSYFLYDTGIGQLPENENLIAHYLDVGQGDSIFIELPGSKTMLIDAGVSGMGEGIEEYINDLGYTEIDYLIATHPHSDHIGSMAYIVQNMDIGQIYMPKVSTTTKTYERLLTAISDRGLSIKKAEAGVNIFSESGLTADILAPVTIDDDNLNNCSVVLKITCGSNEFLFTGDAEKEELAEINADLSADVLKVGHHGSRTSTTKDFLYDVNPCIAVISAGKDNEYGHPHEQTIGLLNDFDVETYRTDTDGTVIVTSDGSNLSVETGGKEIERNN